MIQLILSCLTLTASTGFAAVPPSDEDLVLAGDTINLNSNQGSIVRTKRFWDLSITGPGFFVLQDAETSDSFYTRLGQFEMDREGYVVLSKHPNLRLVLDAKSHPKTLNMVKWVHFQNSSLVGLAVDSEDKVGEITAVYDSGETVPLGTVYLARFNNS